MTLFHQVCNRLPVVHIAPETETNTALQECLWDVIAAFALIAFLVTLYVYAQELMENFNV